MRRLAFLLFLVSCLSCLSPGEKWPRHAIHDSSRGQDGLEFGDPNGDGHPDLVSAFEIDQAVKIMINPGKGTKARERWKTVVIAETPDPEDAMFTDLDGDGNLDVIVSQGAGNSREGREPGVKILWGPPASKILDRSAWSSGLIEASAGKGHFLYSRAIQLDGRHGPDIIATGRSGANLIWLEAPENPRRLRAWKHHLIDRVGGAWVFHLVDVDADGDRDVILADVEKDSETKGVCWLENPGAGPALYETWTRHGIGGKRSEMQDGASATVGDVDRDGLIDVVLQGNSVMLYFRLTETNPVTWETHRIPLPSKVGRLAKDVAIVDLDGDGRMELVANRGDPGSKNGGIEADKWAVYWMSYTGATPGTDWTGHLIRGGMGRSREKWERIRPYDVDGDGDLDLITNEKKAWTDEGGSVFGVAWFENTLPQTGK